MLFYTALVIAYFLLCSLVGRLVLEDIDARPH